MAREIVNRNLEFLGFFDRCDRLVSYWSKYQACPTLIFYPIWPFIFIAEVNNLGFYIWIAHAFILTIFAFIGFFKARSINKTLTMAAKIISKHPNKNLVNVFKTSPMLIRTIMVLELFLPLTWIASFPLKFLFYKNMYIIKSLIIDCKNLD